jgi:transcriptional regulator with XRE-family HTH domain
MYRPLKEQVYELVESLNWRVYDLAEELGVSSGRLSHILNYESRVGAEVIERIANVLGVKPEHFDLYVVRKLGELAKNAPGLISLGRCLLAAKDERQFARIAAKIA